MSEQVMLSLKALDITEAKLSYVRTVMLSLKALDMNEAELRYVRTGHAQSQSSRYD